MIFPLYEITEGVAFSSLLAYIDPGSGHTFLQLILSGIVGIPLALGRAIRRFFASMLGRNPAPTDPTSNQSKP